MVKCARAYLNPDVPIVRIDLDESELDEWLDYNRVMRFGNALFVNGTCVQNGYLDNESCAAIEYILLENL